MSFVKKNSLGILLCLAIGIPSYYLGTLFPIIGGPVFAILIGMAVAFIPKGNYFDTGIKWVSKKVLQFAVVLLGFSMNLLNILQVGAQSLPIIISTISTALILGFILCKVMKIPSKEGTLVAVGSSICGGSAIAAAAPVVDADDEEIAKSISVIFLFNVIAALIFPALGQAIGFTDEGFGMWAGTAINDTSSVTAAGQSWNQMMGTEIALQSATIVKLTRTLCIIPICLGLAFWRTHKAKAVGNAQGGSSVKLSKIFPWFILFFLGASVVSTALFGIFGNDNTAVKTSMDFLSHSGKFCITLAMAAIGLNTNVVKLVKTGGKAILMGLTIWVAISLVSLGVQYVMQMCGVMQSFA